MPLTDPDTRTPGGGFIYPTVDVQELVMKTTEDYHPTITVDDRPRNPTISIQIREYRYETRMSVSLPSPFESIDPNKKIEPTPHQVAVPHITNRYFDFHGLGLSDLLDEETYMGQVDFDSAIHWWLTQLGNTELRCVYLYASIMEMRARMGGTRMLRHYMRMKVGASEELSRRGVALEPVNHTSDPDIRELAGDLYE